MDVHLLRPGLRGEDFGLSKGQGTLTALQTGEGRIGVGRGKRCGKRVMEMGGGEETEFFSIKNIKTNNKYK